MTYGTFKVGRLTLTEMTNAVSEKVNASSGVRSIDVKGQESVPPLSTNELTQRHSDVMALPASVVPVIWRDKADRNGYYRVIDSGADLINWQGEVVTSDWSISMERVGSENEVDLESRLSGPLSRQNDHSVVGERIHAPAIGHYAYSAGATIPTTMVRTGSDGPMTVYRGIPVNTHPTWACPVSSYLNGRVRFLDANGYERSGVDLPLTPTGWQFHNGLVRVRPTGTVIEVGAWDPELNTWSVKNWDFRVSGSPLGVPSSVTILRNEPEMGVVRVLWVLPSGPGRVTADFTIRRGSRFAEVWVETQTAATIRVQRGVAEAAAPSTGYITATANDSDGNKYFIGSARTASQDTTAGAIFKAGTRTLGLVIGAVVGGTGAAAGDTAGDLFKQYVGSASERVEGVRR